MRKKRSSVGSIFLITFFLGIVAGIVYLANSPIFERNIPEIEVSERLYWNLKSPLKIRLKDDSGVKSYKVVLNDGTSDFVVLQKKMQSPQKYVEIAVDLPRVGWNRRATEALMHIQVTDASGWNFFKGNSAEKSVQIAIDTTRPTAFVLSNSYKITQGGSALVVFSAKDAHLSDVSVRTSFGKVFKAEPFYKKGYYISLIAWPVQEKKFRAWVEASDLAGNRTKVHIPLFIKRLGYRKSTMHLKDSYLNGKVADLASLFDETANISDPLERFRIINEDIRAKNENLIHTLGSKVSDKIIKRWSVKPFYPLKNSKKVAGFGDRRLYYYKGKLVSESYHLGIDLASIKMAQIRASNPGRVVYSGYNGIYGNMPMIDHGLGLYTLYGHCSSVDVREGDDVAKGDPIAKTGKTGLALGDHLHFGIVVQGVEVRPVEWMDSHWIRDNISQVMQTARKIIDRRDE